MKELKTAHGILKFPVFFPDATEGFVKAVHSEDLQQAKVDGIVTNAYHLERLGLVKKIKQQGGIQKYMKFDKPFISDSGGFQVMSLIRDNKFGKIYDDKVIFELDGKRTELTPESCIQIQINLGTDIIMCLDDCTRYTDSPEEQKKSVKRTIVWARKCKDEFNRLTKNIENKPLIFGIIQGGNDFELRKFCADELKKIGFDGYGWGGWSIDENGVIKDLAKFIAEQMPDDKPKYAMGIGDPWSVVENFKLGFNIFDCIVPTREARRQRLYFFSKNPDKVKRLDEEFFDYLSIKRKEYSEDKTPISKFCDCECCSNYSKANIREMFRDKEKRQEAMRLATIHNLRFYSKLMEVLRGFNPSD